MIYRLEKDFSPGLHHSDLGSVHSKFGTGSNLTLQLNFQCTPEFWFAENSKWAKVTDRIVSELDHVHLEFDHAELQSKKVSESELLEWIVQKIKIDEPDLFRNLCGIQLRTSQQYELTWQK